MGKIILILLMLVAWPSHAQEPAGEALSPGQAAPVAGAFFTGDALVRLTEGLRDLESLQRRLEVINEELAAKSTQIAEQRESIQALETARAETAGALAKAEFVIQNWQLIYDSMRALMREHQALAAEQRNLNEQLSKELKSAHTELRWTKILAAIPLIGAIALAF